MFVHRSNSLEELVDGLHRVLRERALPILAPETILIQSAGMERYLSRELARRSGITANVKFPFPRAFLHEVLDRALGKDESAQAFDRERLTWSLFSDLPAAMEEESRAFDVVRDYLTGDDDHSRRLLLAEKIAYLFDQYVTYRPRMILAWEGGADPRDFQAILWRRLVARQGRGHFAARSDRFMNDLSDEVLQNVLPARISLMGGPGLPPSFLQMFARMGRVVPVHVFSFSVCQEYFADAHSLGETLPELGQDLHPLLVSLGKVGADYQHLLEMVGEYHDGTTRFIVPPVKSTLSALQSSLALGAKDGEAREFLRRRAEERKEIGAVASAADDSLTIDSCHSPLREVEVLHDRLCRWFAEDSDLRPEDVVVLAPQIEEYSPLISAVFSARAGERPYIPYRIADRSERHTNPAARAFLLALTILRGRFKASEVLDLLQLEPVRARYGIQGQDLEKIVSWVREAGIRWGVDGEHRAEFGLPPEDANTWRFGLRRLLLGYALFDQGGEIWDGTVPFDAVGVRDLELIGRMADFVEGLFSLRSRLTRAGAAGLSPEEWRTFLTDVAACVVTSEGQSNSSIAAEWDASAVERAIFDVTERALVTGERAGGGSVLRLGLRGMIHLVSAELEASRPSTDFLTGGVTFCALLPLRTIPFRRVCVLGLNQGEFPRTDGASQLDKMSQSPKRGDRSLRADDRYLFLEVILAARERLALSFVGRSVQDNTKKPPSVVLSELDLVVMDLIGQTPKSGQTWQALAVVEHPLQPFHPGYFGTARPELVSFDERAFSGASALSREPDEVSPFFSTFARRTDDGSEIEWALDDLVRFWKDPTQAYLRARGVRIDDSIQEVEDREPVVETGLVRYSAGDQILARLSRGESLRRDVELARGTLPIGRGGEVLLDEIAEAAADLVDVTQAHTEGKARGSLAVQFALVAGDNSDLHGLFSSDVEAVPPTAPLLLLGSLEGLHHDVLVETSYGTLNSRRKVAHWVRHLALCACATEGVRPRSVLVVRSGPRDADRAETFLLHHVPAERARKELGRLLRLAELGSRLPLSFFADASEKYHEALIHPPKSHDLSPAQVAARAFGLARAELFSDKPWKRVESTPLVEVYRGRDPIGDLDSMGRPSVPADDLRQLPFARLAEMIFGSIHEFSDASGPSGGTPGGDL